MVCSARKCSSTQIRVLRVSILGIVVLIFVHTLIFGVLGPLGHLLAASDSRMWSASMRASAPARRARSGRLLSACCSPEENFQLSEFLTSLEGPIRVPLWN